MQFFSNALGIGRAMVLCNNAELVPPPAKPDLVETHMQGRKSTLFEFAVVSHLFFIYQILSVGTVLAPRYRHNRLRGEWL